MVRNNHCSCVFLCFQTILPFKPSRKQAGKKRYITILLRNKSRECSLLDNLPKSSLVSTKQKLYNQRQMTTCQQISAFVSRPKRASPPSPACSVSMRAEGRAPPTSGEPLSYTHQTEKEDDKKRKRKNHGNADRRTPPTPPRRDAERKCRLGSARNACMCACVCACGHPVLSHGWAGHADRNRLAGGPAVGGARRGGGAELSGRV